MIPQRFAASNCVHTAPPGMENCSDVHSHVGDGHVITAWRPTPEELVKINLGEPIWLWVIGATMPPVALTLDDPFQPKEVCQRCGGKGFTVSTECCGHGDYRPVRVVCDECNPA